MDLAQFSRSVHETWTYLKQFLLENANRADFYCENFCRTRYIHSESRWTPVASFLVGTNNGSANNFTRWNPFVLIMWPRMLSLCAYSLSFLVQKPRIYSLQRTFANLENPAKLEIGLKVIWHHFSNSNNFTKEKSFIRSFRPAIHTTPRAPKYQKGWLHSLCFSASAIKKEEKTCFFGVDHFWLLFLLSLKLMDLAQFSRSVHAT